ncbi:MAG: DUF5131 family protein [Clostridia bacterium]|nr:DUF5131 family protein [Clostridia bacterium]
MHYENWNPWHGCTKISEGCRYCYVYRQDAHRGAEIPTAECRKTQGFHLPVKRKRDGSWKIPPGSMVFTCFSSDFLLKDADPWRDECWQMMRQRQDCLFYFFTKRIDRFMDCIPHDWGDGYPNVMVGCTCENQARADERMPVFLSLPIRMKSVILGPMLTPIDLRPYLCDDIMEVACSGESGLNVRPLHYEWVLDVRAQCVEKDIPFLFHQTGAYFVRDGKTYHVPRRYQIAQAKKAGIDYRIGADFVPDTAMDFRPQTAGQISMDELQASEG